MRVILIVFFALVALGTGGCSAFWLGMLIIDPMWRGYALPETLTYSGIGIGLCLFSIFMIRFIRRNP